MRTSIWFANAVHCCCIAHSTDYSTLSFVAHSVNVPLFVFQIPAIFTHTQMPKINENWVTTCEIHFLPLTLIIWWAFWSALHRSECILYGKYTFYFYYGLKLFVCKNFWSLNRATNVYRGIKKMPHMRWWFSSAKVCKVIIHLLLSC